MKTSFDKHVLNLLEVDDFSPESNSPLRFWYKHLKSFAKKNDGDIFEFGVYRGKSIIAAALILKQLKSKKKIFAFDNFTGFPKLSKFDAFNNFQNRKFFKKSILKKHKELIEISKFNTNIKNFNPNTISTSGDFSNTSYKFLKKKIDYFNLNNIEIVPGDFKKTVPNFFKNFNDKISSCNIDCDLYEGYKIVLPFVWKHLSKNGHIHLDEYYSLKFPGAKIATDNFCKKNKIKVKKNKVSDGEFERWYITK